MKIIVLSVVTTIVITLIGIALGEAVVRFFKGENPLNK